MRCVVFWATVTFVLAGCSAGDSATLNLDPERGREGESGESQSDTGSSGDGDDGGESTGSSGLAASGGLPAELPVSGGDESCTETCSGDEPICHDGECVACVTNEDCGELTEPWCSVEDGECGECTEDAHCTDVLLPACDEEERRCVECTEDAHCGTGTCETEQGECSD